VKTLPVIAGSILCICPTFLRAQIGSPLDVTYKEIPTGEDWFPMKGFQWKTEAGTWTAEFDFQPAHAGSNRSRSTIRVTDPEGASDGVIEDPLAKGVIWEEMTGSFSDPPKWTNPWICSSPGMGREVFLGEQKAVGDWQVFRILWHVAGASGPPPMPFVLVVANRKSGRWVSLASALEYPPTPDRGDIMSVRAEGDALRVSWWYAFTPNVYELKGWAFTSGTEGVSYSALPRSYSLFTWNGSVTSLGSSPAEAIRKGWLEVVWPLKRWNSTGGVGVATDPSPRRLTNEDDALGAPIIPAPGSRKFVWARDMFVVPRKGKAKHVALEQALSYLNTGRWGVVLFPLANGPALASRLVEFPAEPRGTIRVTPPPGP